MRVAVCFEFASLNGGENSFLALVPYLLELGVQPVAVAPHQGALTEQLRRLSIPVEPWRSGNPDERLPSVEGRRSALRSAVLKCQPDIVHGNSLNMTRLLGPVVAELRIPSVGHLRDILTLSGQAVRDLARHDQLLAVSHATKAFHTSQGLPAELVSVLYNGVDLKLFCPRHPTGFLHRELAIPAGTTLVGGIGQLGLRKGWENAILALEAVATDFPQLHLAIVGEQLSTKREAAEHVDHLQRLAHRASIQGRVHFLGRREDIPALLNELTILVHPAHQEPLGRVLLEAAAAGLPVIATDVGGTSEIFSGPKRSAMLVSKGDVGAIADAVVKLLNSEALRIEIAGQARQNVQQRFRLDRSAALLRNHYTAAQNSRLGGNESTSF